MKKSTGLLIVILGLFLTACGGNASPTGNFTNSGPSGTQTGSSTGLAPALQVAIGTLKLDKTTNDITAQQAADLLPLWETLQVLESSDTAATQEKNALIAQIQETMTKDQMQTIAEMGLTRQDMAALLQAQGQTFTLNAGQNGNSTNSNATRRNSGGGGGFFVGGGGPPPDGGGFGGGGNFAGQGTRPQSTNNGTTTTSNRRQFSTDPNRIPTPLIQAVIEYLKKKAGPSYP